MDRCGDRDAEGHGRLSTGMAGVREATQRRGRVAVRALPASARLATVPVAAPLVIAAEESEG